MKKKAFTLVELLAVIVILAVILVIAVPQISKVIKQTKINSLASTAKLIAAKAEEKEVENQATESNETISCASLVKLDDDYDGTTCTIEKINGVWTTNISGSSTGKFAGITCSGTKSNMVCTSNDLAPGEYLGAHPCTYEGELVDGATYTNGQYDYTYIANEYKTWKYFTIERDNEPDSPNFDPFEPIKPEIATPTIMTTGGWHVKANSSTTTSTICSSVNKKPIISMAGMYEDKDMSNYDLSTIDTSNVIDMAGMFASADTPSLDVSNFDTSKVIRMFWMFTFLSANQIIGLDHFNTENVINMNSMFRGIKTETLDLSSFDTHNVLDFSHMFDKMNMHTIYASDKFVTTGMPEDGCRTYCHETEGDVDCSILVQGDSCDYAIISNRKIEYRTYTLTGGNGTICDEDYYDATYARIDAPGQPGCFTAKP